MDSFGKKTILEDYGNGDIIVYKSKIYTSYAKNDDNTIVLYFESGHAVISSFTEEPKVIDF